MTKDSTPHSSFLDAVEDVRVYLTWVPPDHAKAAAEALQRLEEQVEAERQRAAAYQASEREWRRIAQNGTDRLKEQHNALRSSLQALVDWADGKAGDDFGDTEWTRAREALKDA